MPGMLAKSRAFVPRNRNFESVSLQRRVVRTPVRTNEKAAAMIAEHANEARQNTLHRGETRPLNSVKPLDRILHGIRVGGMRHDLEAALSADLEGSANLVVEQERMGVEVPCIGRSCTKALRRPGSTRSGCYLDEVIPHGTPDKIGDEIMRLREEIGLDYLLCAPLSHQSFMLLTEKVLPRVP